MTIEFLLNILMKIVISALTAILLASSPTSFASSWFIGYELGEMVLNDFKHVAGEVGYNLPNDRSIRLTYMNVALSEEHLSSSSAGAVDGDNVAGLWRGAELYYDFPVSKHIYISPSVGYYNTKYWHEFLDESVKNKSMTAGVALSYLGDNVLGAKEFYWKFSLTYRYNFNAIERTMLGDSVVVDGTHETIPWIFVGYRFN